MIVALSNKVRQQLTTLAAGKRTQSEETEIKQTAQVLSEVRKGIERLLIVYATLQPRLSESANSAISSQIVQLTNGIAGSQQSFRSDRRQSLTLSRLNEDYKRIDKYLTREWLEYASARSAAPLATLDLVRALPEMEPRMPKLSTIVGQLETLTQSPPTAQRIEVFDANLNLLTQELSRLEGLTPAVTQFLNKVIKGSATLADVTGEVAEWCHHGGREYAFKISFA